MPMNKDTAIQLNDMVANTLNSFILLKVTERGWFATSQENQVLRDAVVTYIYNRCARDNPEAVLEELAQDETRNGLAEMISARFLGLDPPPNDEGLLTFAEYILKFVDAICSDNYIFVLRLSLNTSSNGTLLEDPVMFQNRAFPFFSLPAEIRNMVYKEVLVLPDGGLVRCFAPPALLQTNRLFRAEAMPVFYSENHFEITIKRSPEDVIWAAGRYVPHLDKTVWQRFLRMWDVFNVYGSNCLKYIRHITLIYQLAMDNGFDFGGDFYDKRLGFRFSADPFEEDLDGNYGEETDAESESDSSDDDFVLDFQQLEVEADNLEAEDSTSSGYEYEADTDVEEIPAEDIDPVGVFELNRGTFDWPNRHYTSLFLWDRVGEYVPDNLWIVYPIDRLTDMLWRCARDCPLASDNVDLLCEDIQYWMAGNTGFGNYHQHGFYDTTKYEPDNEAEWEQGWSLP